MSKWILRHWGNIILNFFAGYLSILSVVWHTWYHCLFPNSMVWRVHSRAAWFFDVGIRSFFRSIQGRRTEGVREESMQRRGMSWLAWTWWHDAVKDHEGSWNIQRISRRESLFATGQGPCCPPRPVAIFYLRAAWITSPMTRRNTEHTLGKIRETPLSAAIQEHPKELWAMRYHEMSWDIVRLA